MSPLEDESNDNRRGSNNNSNNNNSTMQPPPAHQHQPISRNYSKPTVIPGTSSTLTPIDLSSR